jgi:Serine dehydrogenase proteinase
MSLPERLELYREVEEYRGRPLLVYVTNERVGVPSEIAGDVLPEIMDQLELLPDGIKSLDFLVVSNGGDPTVAFRMVTLIREHVDELFVLIPQAAYSAATLLALGADQIVMHRNGNLGPVDPQIQINTADGSSMFASADVSAFLRYARDEVGLTDQVHLCSLFQSLCNQIGGVPLGFTARADQLAVSLGEKLLKMHMQDEKDATRARSIVESLCKDFIDHGYAVGRKEAKGLGLRVAEPDQRIESLIWSIWMDFEKELLARERFSPLHHIMQSAEAPKLKAPVPQVVIPPGTPTHLVEQAFQNAISVESIEPISLEIILALCESTRESSRNIDRRTLFAVRSPKMEINFNSISVWNGWHKMGNMP